MILYEISQVQLIIVGWEFTLAEQKPYRTVEVIIVLTQSGRMRG